MLSGGKVLVFFGRFVAIFGKKYGSLSPKILGLKNEKKKKSDDH